MDARRHLRPATRQSISIGSVFAVVAIILIIALAITWPLSHIWCAGWLRIDEHWVVQQGSGMAELHTTQRVAWIAHGRMELIEDERLSAVIPAGSSAIGAARHEGDFFVQRSTTEKVRDWEPRWHMSAWNEWRMGSIGWYHTTGGGSTARVVTVPIWFVMLLAGAPWGLLLLRRVRSRIRRRRGLCPACGHPARAPICPECGHAVR